MPITIAYVVFAMGTWLSVPLFNLLLRTSRFGRHALSREQTLAANALGVTLLIALAVLAAALGTGDRSWTNAAIIAGLLVIPVACAGLCRAGLPRIVMVSLSCGLAAGAILIAILEFTQSKTLRGLGVLAFQPYLWLCVLSPLAVNLLNSLPKAAKR
jgi:hypothetical protein